MHDALTSPRGLRCRVAVIWIDWYPYHVARFRGLQATPDLTGHVAGIELIGGSGVHKGLTFRESLPEDTAITTLMPDASWHTVRQFTLARRLWRHLSQLAPDVVLAPGYYTLPAIAAALWARAHGRTSVLMTESGSGDHPRIAWKEFTKILVLRTLFDWAIAGGKAHVDYLRRLGFPAERIMPSYDVVDNNFFREGTAQLRRDDNTHNLRAKVEHRVPSTPYFLYVGRLAEEKHVASLLRSWRLYRERGGSWPLVLAGDGPEAAALHCIAEDSAFTGDVLFPGLLKSTELLLFYAFAGCFILPSTREPWGLVVNEAMAAGLPVIASTRCGCVADLVHPGENGFVFDPQHPDADKILPQLMFDMERLTPSQRQQMGTRSQQLIAGYSPQHFGRSVAAIVGATSEHSPAPRFAGEAS